MESLEMCLPGGLHELGLLEQFKLNTLIHHWRDVVGAHLCWSYAHYRHQTSENCAQRG